MAFVLRHCPACHFSFVANPWTDYAAIYSEAYYAGKGADPLVDYEFELDFPAVTIRRHEWRGITAAVASLTPLTATTTWLDFGCGNGSLVRYCQTNNLCRAFGFEEGASGNHARRAGVTLLSSADLDRRAGAFDIVTAVEVLEHVTDPLATLRQIRSLLRPGGLFFYTTGNAQPYRASLLNWRYVTPEIHVSFYEPETLRQALLRTGFRPEFRGFVPGFTDIIRFKILKNLGIRRQSAWQRILPWPLLARAADARLHVTAHPIAWAE
jgi:cyclopropane fatty-acyl-phospholipid synthase-like methyltransferase